MTTIPSETGAATHTADARRAGIVLIGASLLSIVMMAHHPHAGSQGAAEIAAEIVDKASVARFVHGALIALLGAQLFAFVEFCRVLDRDRPSVRLGFIAYAAGVGAMTGAALISGFLVPDLATRYAQLDAVDLDVFRHLLRLCTASNQVLAKFGVVAMSIGIVAWSIALLRPVRRNAWVGAVGLLAGLAPAIAVLCGVLALDVLGMTLVVVCQTIWTLAVGTELVRGKF